MIKEKNFFAAPERITAFDGSTHTLSPYWVDDNAVRHIFFVPKYARALPQIEAVLEYGSRKLDTMQAFLYNTYNYWPNTNPSERYFFRRNVTAILPIASFGKPFQGAGALTVSGAWGTQCRKVFFDRLYNGIIQTGSPFESALPYEVCRTFYSFGRKLNNDAEYTKPADSSKRVALDISTSFAIYLRYPAMRAANVNIASMKIGGNILSYSDYLNVIEAHLRAYLADPSANMQNTFVMRQPFNNAQKGVGNADLLAAMYIKLDLQRKDGKFMPLFCQAFKNLPTTSTLTDIADNYAAAFSAGWGGNLAAWLRQNYKLPVSAKGESYCSHHFDTISSADVQALDRLDDVKISQDNYDEIIQTYKPRPE